MKLFKLKRNITDEEMISIIKSVDIKKKDRIKNLLALKIIGKKKDLVNINKKLVTPKNGENITSKTFDCFQDKIRKDDFTLKKSLAKIFEICFEKILIKLLNSGHSSLGTLIEKFLIEIYLIETFNQSKRKISDNEIRAEIYGDSLMRIFEILKEKTNQKFRGEASIKTFFNTIFWAKHKDKLRHLNTKKNQFNKAGVHPFEEQLSKVSLETQKTLVTELSCIDEHILNKKIQWLKDNYPKCYKIFYLNIALNYSYKEVAIELNSTESSIKETARQCRNKINVAYK